MAPAVDTPVLAKAVTPPITDAVASAWLATIRQ